MTTDEALRAVNDRMEQLEHQNFLLSRAVKRQKVGLVAALAAFGLSILAVVIGGLVAKTRTVRADRVEAHDLVLVDRNGTERARLCVAEDSAFLHMYDENERARVSLGVFPGGSSLGMSDEDEKCRLGLGLFANGPRLSFLDKNGTNRVGLSLGPDVSSLCFSDQGAVTRAWLGMRGSQRGPVLTFRDENAKRIWSAPKTPATAPTTTRTGR